METEEELLKLARIDFNYQMQAIKTQGQYQIQAITEILRAANQNKHPEIKGYELLQEYPGCNRNVGDFEPYTSGEFSKYPNIWKPIYHKEVERDKKINQILGE